MDAGVGTAGSAADPHAARRVLFARQVAANAGYWRTRLERHAAELPELDAENENLARAIWLGLGAPETRQAAFGLIAAARPFIVRRGGAEAWCDVLAAAARLAAAGPPTTAAVMVLSVAAELYERRSERRQAERYYRVALRLCRRLPAAEELEAGLLVDLGWILVQDSAGEQYLRRAQALAEAHGYRMVLVRALLGLGAGHNLRLEGQAALADLPEALRLAEALGEPNYIGRAHYELATAYWCTGDLPRARTESEEAIEWLQRSGDIGLQGHARSLLGVMYFEQDEFEQAVTQFLAAEADFTRAGDNRELAPLYNNLGATYWGLQRWDVAERYFQQALAGHRARGNELRATEALLNLGECYLDQQKWNEAAAALSEAAQSLTQLDPSTARARLFDRLEALQGDLLRRMPS